MSEDENSTIDIFPKIDASDLLALIGIDQEKIDETLAPVKDEFEKIKMTLTFDLYNQDKTMRSSIPPIQKINKEQALLFLYKLNNELTLTGAVMFERCDTILFQHHGKNHLLMYGDRSYYLHYISHIRFDIDDGFFSEEDPLIQHELQQSFKLWLKNDHVGPVIPKERSGFYLKTASTPPASQPPLPDKPPHAEFRYNRGVRPDFTQLSIEQMIRFAFLSSVKIPHEEIDMKCSPGLV